MSCDTHTASSAFRETLVNSFTSTNLLHSQGLPPSLSGRLSPAVSSGFDSGLGLGLQESGRLSSFNSDASSGDHVRITMKTRVAVRDKKSHRFQVIPLRDITKDALSQAELSSRLMVPNTPASHLCTPSSRKLVSYSQPKSIDSSPSAQSVCTMVGKENRHSEAGTGANVKILGSFDSKASVSSTTPSPVERNAILAEVDLNREEIKSTSLPHLPSNQTIQAKPAVLSNLPSKDSFNNYFSSTPTTHTISRSLHIPKRYKSDASKFASLGYFTLNPEVGNRAQVERESHGEEREAQLFDSAKPRSRKRHAMRTPPLFLPYFERLASSGPVNLDEEQVLYEAISDKKVELGQDATSDIVQSDNDRTICPDFHVFDVYLDDQVMPRRILEDPFSASSSGSIEFAPIDSPVHHSSPKSGNLASRIRIGVNCQTTPRMQRSDRRSGGIVYPKMVLDLFVELDKAIESWSTKNT